MGGQAYIHQPQPCMGGMGRRVWGKADNRKDRAKTSVHGEVPLLSLLADCPHAEITCKTLVVVHKIPTGNAPRLVPMGSPVRCTRMRMSSLHPPHGSNLTHRALTPAPSIAECWRDPGLGAD